MPTVQKFTRDMIEKHLRARNLHFLRDSDGDFCVEFARDADSGRELTMWLMAQGKNQDIYTIRIDADRPFTRNDWGRAMMLCNTWNCDKRWPKAYLYVRDWEKDQVGEIKLEDNVDLGVGVHQELLDDITSTIFTGACLFWEWMAKEQGIR